MSEAADARHHLENLLARYVAIADVKDVPAALDLLGGSVVRFPADGYDSPSAAAAFWGRLWADPRQHRHDVSTIGVDLLDDGAWSLRAHYSRYLLDGRPELITLGEYSLVAAFDGERWRILELRVSRSWSG